MNSERDNAVETGVTSPRQTAHDADSESGSSALTADMALARLRDRALSGDAIEQIVRDTGAMKSRKVQVALAAHPRVPRRVALRLIREFCTFDLMQFSLLPAIAADLKRVADEQLIARIASITLGERVSLARRSSARVAAALLLDKVSRVWQSALENPRVTEPAIVKALVGTGASPAFVTAVCHDVKWSVRPEIRVALLRNQFTPPNFALEFARGLPPARLRDMLRDILQTSRMPEKTKVLLQKELDARRASG